MAKKKKSSGFAIETVKTIIYALLIAGVFRTLFFQPFWIPSGSMKETLLVGDFLFVNKMVYGYSYASCPSVRIESLGVDIDAKDLCGIFSGANTRLFGGLPKRGDVAVFRHPVSGRDFIKRIVGLPEDRIQFRNGILLINGDPVEREDAGIFAESSNPQGPAQVSPQCLNVASRQNSICEKQRQIETLPNGVRYSILNLRNQSSDNTQEFRVPEGHYFMVGDNRDNSSDSRYPTRVGGVGFVPLENFVGRADRLLFSSAGGSLFSFWAWRGDRYFKAIE